MISKVAVESIPLCLFLRENDWIINIVDLYAGAYITIIHCATDFVEEIKPLQL